jgi:hypothetical protein
MKKTALLILIFISQLSLKSQDFTKFSLSGYVDTYYSYDDDKNGNPVRQFTAIAPYREEFRLNIAQVSLKYNDAKVHGAITLQYGDIPAVNWPANQQFIQEAYAGFSPAKRFWIDAGYFLTHIGAEGLLPKGNFLTSLALATYYEPFYQSGIKVSYEFSPKVYACIHLLNGYNVFTDNNKNKSIGLTLGYKPKDNIEVIYNNLIGNEIPSGIAGKTRIYNNLVVKLSPAKKVDILLGGDVAMQENSGLTDSSSSAVMYSGLAAIRFKPSSKFSVSVRGEIFNDKDGFLSGTFTDNAGKQTGLIAYGITLGFELRPVENGYFRIESRYLTADKDQKIFFENKNSRIESNASIGVEF